MGKGCWNLEYLKQQPSSLMSHIGGVPTSILPREGKRTWGGLPVTDTTLKRTESLLIAGRPGAPGMMSTYRAYLKWREVRLQKLVTNGEALAIFGGYLRESGLKASTCSTYLYSALFFEKRIGAALDPQWYLAEDMIRALNKEACSETREHAPDTSEENVVRILDTLQNEEVAFTIWAMCVCGGRAADLVRLGETGGSFVIYGDVVKVHFTLTKNRTEQCEQYSVTLPLWIPFRAKWAMLAHRACPFTVGAQKINDTLHAAGFQETSYSFRRLFINHVINRLTENGITNWMAVIELTGHQQVKMVKGLYKAHN